eukprot:9206091-Pyramimonas_sp.AAC.1
MYFIKACVSALSLQCIPNLEKNEGDRSKGEGRGGGVRKKKSLSTIAITKKQGYGIERRHVSSGSTGKVKEELL